MFQLEEDLENYWEWKLMGTVRGRLKKGAIPHIFDCQKTTPATVVERKDALKRKRLQLTEEADGELKQKELAASLEAVPQDLLLTDQEEPAVTPPTTIHKGVQVNIKMRYRKN